MQRTVSTGTLTLTVSDNATGMPIDDVLDVAARANPKRGFLIVSKLIGRHLPTSPAVMRDSYRRLATAMPEHLPGPVAFVGMAETAVGLGKGVHAAWGELTGRTDGMFIQTTRQTHPNMEVWATFEEGHSHATTHIVHVPSDRTAFAATRTLVLVDDECSTGNTFMKAAAALAEAMPLIERCIEVVITRWDGRTGGDRVALVSGSLDWNPSGRVDQVPGNTPNAHGKTLPGANPGRTGYAVHPGIGDIAIPDVRDGERVLVLADGENAYDALLAAEAIASHGADVAIQSITRSPAHVEGAMSSRAEFDDAHGSGATCYAYNLMRHRPDRIVVVAEIDQGQAPAVARQTGLPASDVLMMEISR